MDTSNAAATEPTTEPAATPIYRKSRKTPHSDELTLMTRYLHRLRPSRLYETRRGYAMETMIEFLRLVMNLTEREAIKFTGILRYMRKDPYYDTLDKVLSFTTNDFIERNKINLKATNICELFEPELDLEKLDGPPIWKIPECEDIPTQSIPHELLTHHYNQYGGSSNYSVANMVPPPELLPYHQRPLGISTVHDIPN